MNRSTTPNTSADSPTSSNSSGSETAKETAAFAVDSMRSVWRLGWPVTITMGAHTAFGLADLYWISSLGTDAVAAVSLVGNMLFVLFVLTQIVYVGGLAMISRRIGAGRLAGDAGAEGVAAQVLPLSLLFGLGVASAGVALARPSVLLFGASSGVTTQSIAYLVPMMATYLPIFPYVAFSAIFTAAGDTRTPMYIGVVSNIANAILDPFLIFGWAGLPAWGVAGAAVASLISSLMAAILMAVAYRYRPMPFPRARLFAWHGAGTWPTVLRIGIPGSIGMLTRPLSTVLLLGVMARFGAAGVAAFGITIRALSILWLYHGALSTAVSTLTGQGLGAGDVPAIRRLVRRSIRFSLALSIITGVVYFVWAREIVGIFERSNTEVLELGTTFMRLLVLSNFGTSFSVVWGAAMNGAGDTRPPMVVALLANWVVKLPLAYLLAVAWGIGVNGVWWAMFISLLFESVATFVWYRRDGWTRAQV